MDESPRHTSREGRVALALEAGRLGTWRWDVVGGVLDWDEPLQRVFGVEPGTFEGTFDAYLALLHPDDRAHTVAVIQDSLVQRTDHYVEHRVVLADGGIRWVSGTGRVVLGDDDEPVAMVGVGADITVRKLAEDRLEFLVRAGELLGTSLDLDRTLQQLGDLAIEGLADWCSVDLLDGGEVRLVAVSHRDPDKVAYARRLRERFGVDMDQDTGLPLVLRTGEPDVMADIDEEFLRTALAEMTEFTAEDVEEFIALGLRSSMTVPLVGASGMVLGALTLVTAQTGRRYDERDVSLAMEVARRAGAAVENAQLYARAEHAARTLQQSLLPPVLPDLGFAELAAYYAPTTQGDLIGGDFYDVFPVDEGRRWCLVVGDVSGKGVDAAALTAAARWTLRSALARTRSAAVAVGELNDALLEQDWGGRYVTVVAAMVTAQDDGTVSVEYACGGHPAPLVVRRDGHVDVLPGDGQIVGLLETVPTAGFGTTLASGDRLALYSDGFTDVRVEGRLFGESGMVEALSGMPPSTGDAVVDRLTSAALAFGRQVDDMALLVLAVP